MTKIIATNIDGTLLKNTNKFCCISKENRNFIKDYYGDVVLCSRNNPLFCAKICSSLDIEHNFVALNGAVIVRNGKIIYKKSLKKTITRNLFDFLIQNYSDFKIEAYDKYDNIVCYSSNASLKEKINNLFRFNQNRIILNNKKFNDLLLNSVDIYKLTIYSNGEFSDLFSLIKNKYNDHFEFYENNNSLEISPKGISKGKSLAYLLKSSKIDKSDVIVVGNGNNDLSMFESFENSYCIKTDNQQVKIKAKRIIDKFSDLDKYTRLNHNFR